ncbi:MAG: EamA family transporter [Alphaproteobacteria bacterium]
MSPQFFSWLAAFSFAIANVTVRHGMRYSTPLTATFVSLIIHTTVLWSALLLTRGIPSVKLLAIGAICLTGIAQPAMRFFQYKGMDKIGASRAVTLRNTYPVLTIVIGITLLGEQLTRLGAFGAVLVVLGIFLSSWKLEQQFKDFRWLHAIYPLITSTITAFVHPLRRYALLLSNEPLFFAALVGPVSLFAFAIYYWSPASADKLAWDRRALIPFLVSGTGETLAVLFLLLAYANGPVVIVAPISSTVPIWTMMLAAVFLRDVEHFTRASILGAVLVVIGVIAISLVK